MNVLALCAGIGGIELGLRMCTESRVVCYVERDEYCQNVLMQRMRDGQLDDAPIWDDVKTFDARTWRGVVDCVTAGYPCQPFSLAGKRQGVNDPRHLWPDIARIIGECEPALVFCENVSAHLHVGFDQVAGDLHRMGFAVAGTLWTAAELGAWHRRERYLWLAAHSDRLELWDEHFKGQRQTRKGPTKLADDGHTQPVAHSYGLRELEPQGLVASVRRRTGNSRRWKVEPSVGRVADGVPNRMDRLRALGNAVVPQVAACAFTEMWEALNG